MLRVLFRMFVLFCVLKEPRFRFVVTRQVTAVHEAIQSWNTAFPTNLVLAASWIGSHYRMVFAPTGTNPLRARLLSTARSAWAILANFNCAARLVDQTQTCYTCHTVFQALVAGVFVLGIGTGVTVDSAINTDPRDLASRDAIDRNAPNPNICQTYGSSAMVVDQRVFVTFNPFSLHVSQVCGGQGCVTLSGSA